MSEGRRRAATLPVRFFARPADIVARELLGTVIVCRAGGARTAGRIVETEAYLGYDDPASHGFRGRKNDRNAAIFGPPGSWYVYLSYGVHWCANLVCGRNGEAAAVLIRALEPIKGIGVMRLRRRGAPDTQLCSGPGKLCQAMGITRVLNGAVMSRSEAVVRAGAAVEESAIAATPRIGITKAAEWPMRFVVVGSPYLSRPSPAHGSQG